MYWKVVFTLLLIYLCKCLLFSNCITCRYLAGVAKESTEPVLLRIAEEVDLSHSLLARIVLERHLSHTCFDGENRESIMSGFNRPFWSSKNPHFENEAKSKTFLVIMS